MFSGNLGCSGTLSESNIKRKSIQSARPRKNQPPIRVWFTFLSVKMFVPISAFSIQLKRPIPRVLGGNRSNQSLIVPVRIGGLMLKQAFAQFCFCPVLRESVFSAFHLQVLLQNGGIRLSLELLHVVFQRLITLISREKLAL